MTADDLYREMYAQRFTAECSMRYHEHRAAFYQFALTGSQWLEAMLGASAFCVLLAGIPVIIAKVITAAITAVSMLAIILKSSERLKHHMSQKARLGTLLQNFPADLKSATEREFKKLRDGQLEIQKDDGRILDCLNVICHNAQCVAKGRADAIHPLTRLQSTFGSWLPLRYAPQPADKTSWAAVIIGTIIGGLTAALLFLKFS